MNVLTDGPVLRVTAPEELNASQAGPFRDQVRAVLRPEHTQIDLDFSQTSFVDSSGLGALIALHKTICHRQGRVRVLAPSPKVLQILELTRLHRVLEIVAA